jgi:mediator of RNA polymerase II transcription subunit 13
VHGESTVCASMDIREHPPIRPLTEEYLNEVIKNTQQNIENCSPNDDDEKEDFNNDINHNNVSMQSVILAPFGLSAVLTGNRSESCEQFADKIMNDWNNFYPMKDSDIISSQSKLPQLVEVNSGE